MSGPADLRPATLLPFFTTGSLAGTGTIDDPARFDMDAELGSIPTDDAAAGDFELRLGTDGFAKMVEVADAAAVWTRQSKTANYTALITDSVVYVDASGGTVTITMPAAAAMTAPIEVVNIGATGSVVIDPNGAETITGPGVAAALTLTIPPTVGITLDAVGGNLRII